MNRAPTLPVIDKRERVELTRPEAGSRDNDDLLELSRLDLEAQRVRALTRSSWVMLASSGLLLLLVLGLLIVVSVMMNRLNDSIAEIADAVGPSAIAHAVAMIQKSLENAAATSGNFLSLSENSAVMGDQLLLAVNQSVSILSSTNQLAETLLAHPTITMALGNPTR